MLYKDWKKEIEHHYDALRALEDRSMWRYRISDTVLVLTQLLHEPPGFRMVLSSSMHRGQFDLGELSHGEMIMLVNLHEAFTRYVANDNPLREESDLPDPAIWNLAAAKMDPLDEHLAFER